MAWWAWIVVGALLLGLELFAIDAQFFLVFLGLGAIVVGSVAMVGIDLPVWAQWLLFAALSLVAMFTIRRQVYAALRRRPLARVDSDTNQRVQILEDLLPGKTTRIEYRGSGWTALNVSERAIAAGEEVRIESVEGLTLHVRPY